MTESDFSKQNLSQALNLADGSNLRMVFRGCIIHPKHILSLNPKPYALFPKPPSPWVHGSHRALRSALANAWCVRSFAADRESKAPGTEGHNAAYYTISYHIKSSHIISSHIISAHITLHIKYHISLITHITYHKSHHIILYYSIKHMWSIILYVSYCIVLYYFTV